MKVKKTSHHNNAEELKMRKAALLKQAPVNICKGAAIGVGAILPGISGGVLCVVFGIYKPYEFLVNLQDFSHLLSYLFLYLLMGVGFFGLGKGREVPFVVYQTIAIWFYRFNFWYVSFLARLWERRTVGLWIACGCAYLFLADVLLRIIQPYIEPSFLVAG